VGPLLPALAERLADCGEQIFNIERFGQEAIRTNPGRFLFQIGNPTDGNQDGRGIWKLSIGLYKCVSACPWRPHVKQDERGLTLLDGRQRMGVVLCALDLIPLFRQKDFQKFPYGCIIIYSGLREG
jgi:hypothetical protein